jgi:hypothetical protein
VDFGDDFNKFERVEPDSPLRCQAATGPEGQCRFRALPLEGVKYCFMHGQAFIQKAKKEARRLYDIQKYRQRVDALGDEAFKSNLDEELGIQRMVLENLLNKFTDVEMVTQSSKIGMCIKEIRETMTANLKLKAAMGELLDRAAISKLCDAMVVILARRIKPEDMDAVVAEVASAIAEAVSSSRRST